MYKPPCVCATYDAVNAPLAVLTSGPASQVKVLQAAVAEVIAAATSPAARAEQLSHRSSTSQPIVRLATSHEWRSSRHSRRMPEARTPDSLPARDGTS